MATVSCRVFAITGGASGTHTATSQLLAQGGAAALCIGDISNQNFSTLEKKIKEENPSTEVHCSVGDVTSAQAVGDCIQSITSTFGDLHGAANVAGISQGVGY